MKRHWAHSLTGVALGALLALIIGNLVSNSRERFLISEASARLNLPGLPPNARILYAHYNKTGTFDDWYVFGFEVDAAAAKKWVVQARERQSLAQRENPAVTLHAAAMVDFSALIRDKTNVQVQMCFDYTRTK